LQYSTAEAEENVKQTESKQHMNAKKKIGLPAQTNDHVTPCVSIRDREHINAIAVVVVNKQVDVACPQQFGPDFPVDDLHCLELCI
jgi:hypothetical protein